VGEVYSLGLLAVATGVFGFYTVWRLYNPKSPPVREGGKWRRVQETAGSRNGRSSLIRIYLVREYRGQETARLFVAEIDSDMPDWNSKYTDAIAEADNRLAALEFTEQR
jgi:hypothetical protein